MESGEQPSTPDDEQSLALRKMIVEQLESILLNIHKLMALKKHEPDQQMMLMMLKMIKMMTNFFRPVVLPMDIGNGQQEMFKVIEEFQKLLLGGARNDVPKERILLLKFLDEVLDPVHTRRELRGIKSYPLQVALLDETGKTVTRGPESSASVEIVLADASGKDGGHNATHGNFERRIIKTRDKKKPHFAKSVCINLKGGVGNLIGVKLGQSKEWTKNSKCSLGVRLVEKFGGITVQEGWTAPFLVKDNRSALSKKHDRPSLGSEVSILKGIDQKGKPCKRLEEEKIKTVQDFLFWLSVNPEGLQKILNAHGIKWKNIVDHAWTCKIDDKKIFFHKSSTEPQMGVIYDVVGRLRGVINESRFVPINNLSADKKEHARKLLSSVLEGSAFVERYKTFFYDLASLLQRYPSSINFSIQQSWNGNYLPPSGNINIHQPTGPGSSFPSNSPINEHFADMNLSGAFEYNNGGGPTDLVTLGCRSQNAGTSEAAPDRVISMNSSFDDMGGDCNDPCYGFMHRYMANIQKYSHADESNADDGNAAPVEPQAVNADDETVEPQAVNIHQPTISVDDYLASKYDNGGTPTDQGCRRQNAGTSELVGESSRSETPSHRLYSMNFTFEDIDGFSSTDEVVAWFGNFDVPNTHTHSHTNESNVDDGSAAPVEPQAVNTSNPPKRWKRVFCVMMMISIRVLDVAPKQKRQKVG